MARPPRTPRKEDDSGPTLSVARCSQEDIAAGTKLLKLAPAGVERYPEGWLSFVALMSRESRKLRHFLSAIVGSVVARNRAGDGP